MNNKVLQLADKLGYCFNKPEWMQQATTHRSYSTVHNERLEFLGDSILGCVIANYLYNHFPALSEGELSRLRSNLVRENTLVLLAQQLEVGEYLRLGEGERKSGGAKRPSILADAMEALFGAVFQDGGYAAAEQVVLALYVPYMEQVDLQTLGKDAKTLLQELLQSKRLALPVYDIVAKQGEAHAQMFKVQCRIDKLKVATFGEGGSRRQAEQQAAQLAYHKIKEYYESRK